MDSLRGSSVNIGTMRRVAPIAQLLRIGSQMQEVRGLNPRLGGLRVSQLQASGGTSTLQSRASGLQSTTQGNSIRTKKTLPSQTTTTTNHIGMMQIILAWTLRKDDIRKSRRGTRDIGELLRLGTGETQEGVPHDTPRVITDTVLLRLHQTTRT